MKKSITILSIIFLLISTGLYAQGEQRGCNPDSLIDVTVSGTAIVDTNQMHPIYFLDENNDGVAEYKLNFGPFWYQPDSSNAVRPLNGEQITILGGQHELYDSISVIVVYEINGEFWREPFEPFWNNFAGHHNFGRHHGNDFRGFATGWRQDSLLSVTLSGTALVDTTFYMNRYYLDVNTDGYPDYFLNFGPFWYQPVSGAVRPVDGDSITITGGLIDRDTTDVVIVFELNGVVWRDSTSFRRNLGSGWIHKNMRALLKVHNPFDGQDNLSIQPGWHGGGHMGGMMDEDSLFCQLLELYPENIPNAQGQNAFTGFEIGMFNSDRSNKFWSDGHKQRMNFSSKIKYQLHYTDAQLEYYNADESNITVKSLDEQSGTWVALSNVSVDYSANTVSFEEFQASSNIILTAEKITGVANNSATGSVSDFALQQNYPNPFNPSTVIEYTITNSSGKEAYTNVELTVFDILGQQVATLVNENQSPGTYKINFNAGNLTTGIYLYKLKAGNFIQTNKMILVK